MAEKKFVDGAGVKVIKDDYEEKIGKKVDAVEGKSLVDDTEITKLQSVKANAEPNNIKKVQIGETEQTIGEDGTLTLDIEAVIEGDHLATDEEVASKLQDYTKTTELANETGLNAKFATKEEMGNLGTIIGECTTEELETKKEETGKGDCWVTTDDNHIHYYNGESFIDLGGNIDLGPYMKTTDADNKYAEKTAVESLQSTVEGLDSTYATDTELSTAISGLSDTYAAKADLPEAMSEEEIRAILQPGD